MPKALKYSSESLSVISQVFEMPLEKTKHIYRRTVEMKETFYALIDLPPSYDPREYAIVSETTLLMWFKPIANERDDLFNEVKFKSL